MLPEHMRNIIGERRNDAKYIYHLINTLLLLILIIVVGIIYVKVCV